MSRKRKGKAAGASVRGQTRKGRPTPKNTPGEMTRTRYARLQARRASNLLGNESVGVDHALETIRAINRGDKDAIDMVAREGIEMITREAAGVLLDPKEQP